MNLDTMSAHETLVMAVTTAYKEDYLPVIESALRKAFIREASVGVVSIKHDCTLHDTLEHCRLTWIAEVKRGKYEDYDLIPKETP